MAELVLVKQFVQILPTGGQEWILRHCLSAVASEPCLKASAVDEIATEEPQRLGMLDNRG